jgi:outer membrane protein TolC
MNKTSRLLVFSGLLLSSNLYADQKITFNEAIDLAVKNNLEVQASYEEYKASEYDKKSTRGLFLPKISAGLSYEKANNELINGASSTTDGYAASISLSQNLFNGFADMASLKIADSNIVTSQANLQETKSQISYDLKNAVANYFYAKDSLVLSRDIKKRREDNLRMVELRFENGRENKGSVLLSKAYLEQAKLDLIKAENAMNVSLTFLRRVLNLPDDGLIEITNFPMALEIDDQSPNFNAIIETTPEAKRFRASLDKANATLQSDKAAFYPSWDVTGSLGKTGNDFFPDDNRRWTVGTGLTWSLFDGGKDFYSTNASKLLVKASEKRLENQNLELKRVLVTNYTAFVEATATVKVSSAFLEASRVRSEIARSKYNNGLTNFDDWDIIENDLITRQKDYTLKIRDRLIAEAAWEKSRGTGVIP